MVIGTAKNHRRRLSLKSIQFFSGYLKKKLVIVEKKSVSRTMTKPRTGISGTKMSGFILE